MAQDRLFDRPGVYRIKIKGNLNLKWSDWFDGFVILPRPDDETLLVGTVRDQAALHGVLAKIRDLGLPLLSVQLTENTRVDKSTSS